MRDTVLVVPTIREKSFGDFLARWDALGLFDHVDLIVVEDNPKTSFEIPGHIAVKCKVTHVSWEMIDADLGELSWIIPRRSDTVRSYGYLQAWRDGYEYILTLDDDCYPTTEEDHLKYDGTNFVLAHKMALDGGGKWWNTLSGVKPRGIPFYNVGKAPARIVNHGLWTNVLDYDAPTQLVAPAKIEFTFDSRVVPHGVYFPMCGMNVMWRREATVLMYHLLMGQSVQYRARTVLMDGGDRRGAPILVKLPFDRFGDIWCGIFMKKIADIKGLHVTSGMPYIRHERASNPFTNLKKEANGLEVNERLWEYVDRWEPDFKRNTPVRTMYGCLGHYIMKYSEFQEHAEYFKSLGSAMIEWSSLFMER